MQAALEYGMGPRGSALICGYTSFHRLLELSIAELKRKEVSFQLSSFNHSVGGNFQTMRGYLLFDSGYT